MFKFIFACFVLQSYGNILQVASLPPPEEGSDTLSTRIVGGMAAPKNLAPYMVSLRTSSDAHFCGGAILNKRWLLTAAHCVLSVTKDSMTAVVGTNNLKVGGDRYKVDSINMHEHYNRTSFYDDICVIRVREDIQFNDHVQPIRLPDKDTGAGVTVVLAGWGALSRTGRTPDQLQTINLTTWSVNDCQEKYDFVKETNPVDGSQICVYKARDQGSCYGDSGSAIVTNGTAVGVFSWMIACARGYPDVFARVYYYKNWILSKISDTK